MYFLQKSVGGVDLIIKSKVLALVSDLDQKVETRRYEITSKVGS